MKLSRCLAIAALLLGLGAPGAWAGPTVEVAGKVVLRLHDDPHGVSASERAEKVQATLDALLQQHLPPQKIAAVSSKGSWQVVWAGHAVVTVSAAETAANHCTAKELAQKWARTLRAMVTPAQLSVKPGSLAIPLGESRHVAILGGSPKLEAVSDGAGLELTRADDGKSLSVRASAVGHYTVTLTRDKATVKLPVVVKEYAGSVPERIYFAVSGSPAQASLLREACAVAVQGAAHLQPTAELRVGSAPGVPVHLEPGAGVTLTVPVEIAGADYFPVQRNVEVVIHNEPVSLNEPSLLMISNRPEKIEREGVLFQASFNKEQAARLLYSHVNDLDRIQYLWVALQNKSDRPARVLVIEADGGPAREELYVGHRCNTRFLEEYAQRQGLIVTIPAHQDWMLAQYRLPPRELVSGLAHLQVLDGDAVDVQVTSSPDGVKPGKVATVLDAPFNPFMIHPKGIFASPRITIDQKVVLNDSSDAVEIPFGRAPWLIDPSSGEPNTGNYGVEYDVRLEITNPTATSRRVGIYFQPVSGVALGSFLLEGRLAQTVCLKPLARGGLATIELAPQETRTVHLMSMPQAGSHYPARLVIQPQQAAMQPAPQATPTGQQTAPGTQVTPGTQTSPTVLQTTPTGLQVPAPQPTPAAEGTRDSRGL
jgi:hypothetical protein